MLWHDKISYLDNKAKEFEFEADQTPQALTGIPLSLYKQFAVLHADFYILDSNKGSQIKNRSEELDMKFQEAFEVTFDHQIDKLYQDISEQFDKEISSQSEYQAREDVKQKFMVLLDKIAGLQSQLVEKVKNA